MEQGATVVSYYMKSCRQEAATPPKPKSFTVHYYYAENYSTVCNMKSDRR